MVQLAPFQRSASVRARPLLSWEKPTAVHPRAEEHDTSSSSATGAPAGFWVGVMVHRVPVQNSASVAWLLLPVLNSPTATQSRPETHETPVSSEPPVPAGRGLGWTAQRVPSHRSVSGRFFPLAPTAVQARALGHDTADKLALVAPGKRGMG